MSVNKELFHLGNDVVRLRQELSKKFPNVLYGGQMNEFGCVLSDLLDLINKIRLAAIEKENTVVDPVETYFMKLKCTYTQMLEITRNVRGMGLSCEINMEEKGYD